MFGIFADGLTTITSVLFPVYASYKAIRTSDPAQITPWLMYWTTLSLFLATENLFSPILEWVPFYAWARLGLHLYLVLPGQQGSVFLYRQYLHPWLDRHERQIDQVISDTHQKAKKAGLGYINQAFEYVCTRVLGMTPKPPTPPQSRNVSYSQSLLNRFSMPAARASLTAAGANDLMSMLGNVVQTAAATGTSRSADTAGAVDLSTAGTLIPTHLIGEERASYISTQRSRLQTLLKALDAVDNGHDAHNEGLDILKKSKSEAEFDDLSYEDLPVGTAKKTGGIQNESGWGKWIWGAAEKASSPLAKKDQ